jgi:prepilin-type N-terminal cleavage/methylation domain-containing protein
MKKKGFTLVELLAVIVILAVILAIAIPSISNMMNNASRNALESSAKLVLKGIELKRLEDSNFKPSDINETTVEGILNIDDSNYQTLTVKEINGIIYITIVGKNKWDKLTVSGTKITSKVEDTVTNLVGSANAPVLTTGMTPIKWDGSAWIDTTSSDTTWYNYDPSAKQWANARTADGSMWVWIPRYIYKISTGWHTSTAGTIDIQFSKGVDDNWNKVSIGNIDLDESANASNGTWTNHPAFTFGDTELTGIWVAKFEASNDGSSNVKIIPNVASWRSISIDSIFTKVRSMETNNIYGWGTTGNNVDTHMMKNTEWGAVAYLSKSTYGINSEIYKNNSSSYYTGRSGGNVGGSQVKAGGNEYIDTGFYTYDGKCASTTTLVPGINANCTAVGNTVSDTSLSYKASTTGNIYGIYDMLGGAWEYISSYVNNNHANLTTYGNSAYISDNRYKDAYTMGSTDTNANNYALTVSSKGEALYETSTNGTDSTAAWYGDYSYMPITDQPWFLRGGHYNNGSGAGTFSFSRFTGGVNSSGSFRPVVLVGVGL